MIIHSTEKYQDERSHFNCPKCHYSTYTMEYGIDVHKSPDSDRFMTVASTKIICDACNYVAVHEILKGMSFPL